jgi:hypothetical protein
MYAKTWFGMDFARCSTTLGAQVYTTTSEPFTVSGLPVQALVSGLLHFEIQC